VTNTWSVPLNIPAGTSRDFVFQAIPTGTNTYVTNSAIAYIGTEVIDRTLDTANNAPATSTVRVLWEPHATNDTASTLETPPWWYPRRACWAMTVSPMVSPNRWRATRRQAVALFTLNADGSYSYTPSADFNGSDSFTYTLTNGNGRATAGMVSLTIPAVNDAPSFAKGDNQTVSEDAGAQTVTSWATAISAGPSDESGQIVTFHVSNDNTSLFSAQPAIAASGTLTYTPAANSNGTATVSIYLTDNGGVANGGNDTSATQHFTITVTAVNDPPVVGAVTYGRAWAPHCALPKRIC